MPVDPVTMGLIAGGSSLLKGIGGLLGNDDYADYLRNMRIDFFRTLRRRGAIGDIAIGRAEALTKAGLDTQSKAYDQAIAGVDATEFAAKTKAKDATAKALADVETGMGGLAVTSAAAAGKREVAYDSAKLGAEIAAGAQSQRTALRLGKAGVQAGALERLSGLAVQRANMRNELLREKGAFYLNKPFVPGQTAQLFQAAGSFGSGISSAMQGDAWYKLFEESLKGGKGGGGYTNGPVF